jgi:nucleotide-binding universal stress UspA family protein
MPFHLSIYAPRSSAGIFRLIPMTRYGNILLKGGIVMYKNIMVPLDGSELAEIALPYAEILAEKLDSKVTLIHVREPGEDPENPSHRPYLSKIAASVEQDIRKSPDAPPGQKVKVASTLLGSPGITTHAAEEIVDYAGKQNAGLIIMATHGRTGIKRWALGSTADKIVRAAKCPVLLIRATGHAPSQAKLEKILVPLDGSKQSEKVLPHAVRLAPRLKADIILFHAVTPLYQIYPATVDMGYYGGMGMVKVPYSAEEMKPHKASAESYLEKVTGRLKEEGIPTNYKVTVGPAGEEIIKAADETGADMVAMSTHGESGFTRWEHGSTTDKVLRAGMTPLLLVRENQ